MLRTGGSPTADGKAHLEGQQKADQRSLFPGPAYPRGYKNTGVDKLEPYEVRDARPAIDPVRKGD